MAIRLPVKMPSWSRHEEGPRPGSARATRETGPASTGAGHSEARPLELPAAEEA